MLRWLSLFVVLLVSGPIWAATGGPDTVGYRWADSDEQDGPSIDEWSPAWSQGRSIINNDDQVITDDPNIPNQVTDLLFDFDYYGVAYNSVNISSNGFIYFGDGGNRPEGQYASRRLPDNNPPDGVIAPAWTDWNPAVGNDSGVWVHSTAQEYVVVWRSPYYSLNITNEAAVRLTPDGRITVFLRRISTQLPGSANEQITIGIESPGELAGLGYYFGTMSRQEGFGDLVEDYAIDFWWEPLAHAPEITPIGDKVVNVGAVLQFTVEATDQDEGDTLTLGVANLPTGAVFNAETGLFRWQPTEGQEGEHQVTFRVTDDGNPPRNDEETVTITVSRINQPPVVTSTPITTATSGQQYVYDVNATDPDGDSLRYRLRRQQSPQGAQINATTGVVTWTPGPGDSGDIVSFSVIVDDGEGGLVLHGWEVGVDNAPPVNNPPVITSTPPTVAIVGQQLVYQVTATDADGHAITFGLFRCPDGANIDRATGRFTWTPGNGDLGDQVTCIVTVRDSEGMLGAAQSMSIAVQNEPPPQNELPVFTTQPPLTATVGGTYQYAANATDPEGTPIRYFFNVAPAGAFVGVATGLVQWEPNQTHLGSQQSFTLVAEDGGGLRAQQSWTVTVSEDINRAPIVTSQAPNEAFAGEEYLYQVVATDPDGDALSFELDMIRSPQGASMTAQGRLTWTPAQNLIGQIVGFRVVVSDANGAETYHDFSVRISEPGPENRDPVISSAPETEATVGEVYTYTVSASDPDGDALTLNVVAMPDGAQRVGAMGFSWTPTLQQVGAQSFSITVTDGQGGSASQAWIVRVSEPAPVNNPPVFTSTPGDQATAGEQYRYTATWNDPDGHAVTFRMVSGPAGMQTGPNGGVLWTPTDQQAGQSHAVVFEIRDSEGATTQQQVRITVQAASQNNAPVFTSQASGQGTVGQAYTYRPSATDADGDDVSFVLTQAPPGASFVQGAVAWLPSAEQGDQEHDFTLRASDGNGGTTDQSWVVRVSENVGNRAPTITSNPVTAATVGQPYTYQVTATDPDGDRLFYLLPQDQNPPSGMRIDPDSGVLTWTPTQDQGGQNHRVVVAVADEGGLYDAQAFQIGVGVPANEGPRITSQAPGTAQVQQQYVYQVIATDPEGETLRFFTDPDNCPNGASIHVLTGRFTWTPALTDAGSRVTCVIGVVDPADNVDLQQISIQVEGEAENRDPVISSQPSTTATQASPYIYNITASDADGDDLIYTLVNGPNGARITSRGPLNGVIWLVPPGSEGQSFDFEIRVSDGNGGVAVQQWSVTIEGGEPNQPPIITSTPGTSGSPGVVYQYRVQAFDLEREDLTYALEAAPAGAVISDTGNVTWTPTQGQGGQSFAFRLVVTDPRGGVARQNWAVQVTGDPPPPVNNPPVITSEPNTDANVGAPYSYDMEANDPDGDPLFWVLPDDQNPPDGMTINASTGEISWTPTEQGRFQVTAAVTDGTAWAAQRFEISVDAGEANQPPTFTSVPPTQATAGEQLVYQATAEDPEGDAIRFILMQDNCTPGMTINAVTGQFLYTPPPSMIGSTVACVLVVMDANQLANTQSLSIQITDGSQANRPPRITSAPLEAALIDQLYSYAANATDEDGDTLAWVLTAGPQGAFMNATTGLLTWTPTEDDLGSVSFAIEVRDGRGGVHRQQWDATVEEGNVNNEAPVITSSPPTGARVGQLYGYTPTATDRDDDELSWRILEGPQGATINAETGSLSWLPTALYENRDVVLQIEVSDGNDNARQRWTVHVDPQIGGNNPPSITSSPATQVFLGDDYTTTLSATDPDNDSLSWRLVAAPQGTALSSNGILEWSPNLGDLGQSYDFAAEVNDGRGGTDRLNWRVTVPNRSPEITSSAVVEAAVGQAYTYTVRADDEDTGQALTYRIISRVPAGMTINPTSGQITWIPNEAQGGEVFNMVVRAEDTLGAFDEQSFQIGVEAEVENSAPRIVGTAPESASATVLYTHDFDATDADGDTLTWRLDSGPPGMTIDADTGILRWTPSLAQVGQTLSYVVIVTDEEGLFDRQNVLVLVGLEANTPPEFGNEPETTGVVGVEYEFAPRVSDEDADPVSVQLVAGPPSAQCSDGRCNLLTWTPDTPGTYSFHLIASDDRGAEVELRWNVVVSDPAANRDPTFTSSPVTEAQVGEEYTYRASASDPDGDDLVYSLAAISPAMMEIDAQTGEILWTPGDDDMGNHTVVVQVSDGRGGSDLQSFTLVVGNDNLNRPPVVTSDPPTVAVVEIAYEYRVRAFDPDEDDTLSFSLKIGPGGMEVTEEEGIVTWTPPIEAGGQAVMVRVEVTDGEAAVLHEWIIEVEENADLEPIANAGLDRTVDPGRVELDGSASSDPLARGLSYAWAFVEGPSEADIDDPSLEVATVELLHPGEYRFKLTVTASGGRSAQDEVVITVLYGGPIAIAGEDQRVELPATGDPVLVRLEGEAIVLEDDTPIFAWTQISGPPVELFEMETANPEFKTQDPGVYMFELTVADAETTSLPDTVVISVVEPDENEAANWGVDETACGCSGAPFGDLGWLLFALPALRRRRRFG